MNHPDKARSIRLQKYFPYKKAYKYRIPEWQTEKKMQELYSKVCVVGSIKFVASKEREEEEKNLEVDERFSCNLATILARDQEVVTVRLKLFTDKCVVYISKNEIWNKNDVEYINKIKEYFKSIFKDDPIPLDTAFERSDVGQQILSFTEFAKIKDVIEEQFLRYLKKPVKVPRQPIFSWANIIQKFVHVTREYEKFKKRCLDDHVILEKLKEIYGIDGNDNPHLDNENIEQRLYLHAEINILTDIIDKKDKRPIFIAVSKWILPDTKDITFKNDALKIMIANLDIDIRARSDSEGESRDSDNAKHIDHVKVDNLIETLDI
ncbi:5489_t:CDS:2 [Funneliformis geosporum]|nr:5489_t:CDS:2 [Funneliformis geosporum]